MEVIAHPDQITPVWLTAVVNEAGYDGVVDSFTWLPIGAGQVGENARLTLAGQGKIPTTLVAKFPSSDPVSKATGVSLQNYSREVYFYTDLGPTVDVQTPALFKTEFDPTTHDFIIVMEDLAPGIQVDQLDGCSLEQAQIALSELAKLHGPRWGDPALTEIPILNPQTDAETDPAPMYSMFKQGFLERYSARLDASQQQLVNAAGDVWGAYSDYTGPQTLIHIDYRLDNMIFGGPYPVAILDWQSINLGCALNDVAYFMGTSLDPELRRTHEEALVRGYLDGLAPYRVDLSWEDCWRLYRHYAPAGLGMAVIASMIVGETARGNDMFMAMATRSIAMCQDLDTIGLLSGGG